MADDGYEYLLVLKDEMSGPGQEAIAFLNRLETSLKKTDTALHGVHGGAHSAASGISYAVRGFDDLARGGRYAANGLLDVGKAFQRLGPWLAGTAFVGGVAAVSKFAFEVSEAREQSLAAFEIFQGGPEKANETFKSLGALADSIHAPAEKVTGLARELLELGLENQTTLLHTVRAIEDMQRVGLSSGAERIKATVERSLAAGHLVLGRGGAGAARALTGTGISEADVAAQLGLSPKQLEAQLKAGKISVEEGLAAIDHAIIQGKVGALATKKFTVSDAFTDLHNAIRGVFQENDTSPISDAMRRLTDNFREGTEGAEMLREGIDLVFKGVGAAIDLADGLGKAFAEAGEFATGVWEAFGDVVATVGKSASEADRILAERHIKKLSADLGDQMSRQQDKFEKIQALAKSGASEREIKREAARLGLDVSVLPPGSRVPRSRDPVGITREIPGLELKPEEGTFHARIPPAQKKDLHDLGADAVDSVEQGWRESAVQYSPSRVMMDLGKGAFDGLESGAQQGQQMFRSSDATKSGRAVTVNVDVGGLHLPVSVDSDDFMPLLESQIADVFERVALELGE